MRTRAQIERRYIDCGFVYVGNTRMLFALKHTATRHPEDRDLPDLVISQTRWGEPSETEISQVIAALTDEYPGRKIFAETSDGLWLIYEPETKAPAS